MNSSKLLSKKIGYKLFAVLGFFFVFFCKTGKDLAEAGNILWTAAYTGKVLGISLVLGGILGIAVCFLMYRLAGDRGQNHRSGEQKSVGMAQEELEDQKIRKKLPAVGMLKHVNTVCGKISTSVNGLSPVKVFWGCLFLMLLCWLPVFLAYYPGNCAYDSPIQTGQIVNNSFNDHHPIMHTLLIKWAMTLGDTVFGETNAGIAVYTLLQMIFLASVMSYGLLLLHCYKVKAGWQLLILVLCMFHPFNWHMGVSMTKDTLFSGFMLLWICAFAVILLEERSTLKFGRMDLLLMISTMGMIVFRNNAKYAMLVPLVLMIFALWIDKGMRKLWGRLLIGCCAAFLAANVILSSLFSATQAVQGDRREMLSMPIQQLARTMIYHGGVGVLPEDDNTMDEADKALINEFIQDDAYREYQASLSDPVKRHTNTSVVRYQPVNFAKTYLNLLLQYPGDFINAVLAVNAGFLYPNDESHAYVNENEKLQGLGYMQTRWEEDTLNERGIYKDSKWPALFEMLEEWSDENGYLDWPVVKYLLMPGCFLWFWLLFAGYLMIKKDFRMLLPVMLVGGYYLTMFFGPTVQLRYVYPVMLALPFMVLPGTVRSKTEGAACSKVEAEVVF